MLSEKAIKNISQNVKIFLESLMVSQSPELWAVTEMRGSN